MLAVEHDLHMHTYMSGCCSDKRNQRPAKILETALKAGLKTVGFSDHVWNVFDGYSDISRLRSDLLSVSADVRVLVGCEADTFSPGNFSITKEFAETLDFVLLACNHFHLNCVQQPRDVSPRSIAVHMLDFFRSAVLSGLATAVPHAFLTLGYDAQQEAAVKAISDDEFLEVFGIAAERDVAVEITPAFFPRGNHASGWNPASIYIPLRYLSLAKKAGCRFTFGSDAHSLMKIQGIRDISYFLEVLELSKKDILPLALNFS